MARLYDSLRWRRLRELILISQPLCRYCEEIGRFTPATVVDHIKPHSGNEDLFWKIDNLQSLCATCHDSVKKRYEMSGVLKGAKVDGSPVDPDHPWNQTETAENCENPQEGGGGSES